MIKPGTVINDIMSHEDWLPTFLAAAGDLDVKSKLLTGVQVGETTFKAHLDGYNFMPFFKGEEAKGPRHEIMLFRRRRESQRPALRRLEDHLQDPGRKFLQRKTSGTQHAVRRQPPAGSVSSDIPPNPCNISHG